MNIYNSAFNDSMAYVNIAPYLYRYENENYIDDFFNKGLLCISSFKLYMSYVDNQLGDSKEGHSFNVGSGEGKLTQMSYSTSGDDCHCFCTSTVLKKELLEKFSRNSVFRIKNPVNFMFEIKNSLTRVIEVLYGNCVYLSDRTIRYNSGIKSLEEVQLEGDPNKIDGNKLFATLNLATVHQKFLKLMHYQEQSEYRMIFVTDRKITDKIIITCPEAVQHCEKIDRKDLI
jgi:hypothetical protein